MSMVSHVEICEELTKDGRPTRVIKIIEISNKQSVQLADSKPSVELLHVPRHHEITGTNHFDRLPDELLVRIMDFAAMRNDTSAEIIMDPYEAGWRDEEEVIQDAVGFGSSMGVFRLVCWRFFQLATPLFFKRLVICDSSWDIHRPMDMIPRLTRLLSTTMATSRRGQAVRRRTRHADGPLYGHHVRQLIIYNRTIPPGLMCRLFETIHSLLPNLIALGGLSLSLMPRLLTPTIHFPRLVSITGIDLAGSSELWTAQEGHGYPAMDSTTIPRLMAGPNQFISQEIFHGILNHHPHISYLSCRGLQIDETGANRLLALLRVNQLSIGLVNPSSPLPRHFTGLKTLHIGLNSVIDLQLIRLLPGVAPHLQQLHIDAGCKLEDKSTDVSKSWSISQLLRTLPRLTHLTFIAQHNLPNRHGSLEWAGSNEVLRISPQVQSLSLRMDSFTTSDFFDSLEKDSLALRRLNIWHRPTLSLNPASESWSIISFESPKKILKLGHAVRTMTKAGLEWPTIENQQRDLWLKLKALSRLDLFGEHEDEDSSDDL
ncbi:hypothetical protein MJO28_000083 [Puccinia striiformis f. sp. tritici]|uniref:Uncharacterized protein n=3 Tax=Puccinia striiformis TaxID=27350 RepID=A0A0L0V0T1_9BASI|nr:hypothetical protein Pst134EA_001120 [Puccinia striiformis f. sp. tritici]KAI9626008.1 hypothetical protein H4Q26_015996 [Puccinia striiformis f. sp. tritici PST-130]KNE92892.1 hypothetical protein PSTG_13740 [Puccinia striiformis f. sp. tritici PST-78]KAH9467353.1 hypothetical protein Pst134EB_002371 [Puccinia striiformis f. sp. tritici]KAH9474069.1 hypothetical protein Pst134EA_001120 [Puccinia striiformis f. sp. tritici]KAI7961989.1 hypothetical protein MJO28_000083 [Puccinia striiformis